MTDGNETLGFGKMGAGMGSLHVWRRLADSRAQCQKCAVVLTVEEANDCFRT